MAEHTAHLMIIDDDPAFTRVLSRAMTTRGYAVQVCRSAEEALTQAQDQQPDYVTLDLKMEGASGLTLIKPLKAINPDMVILVLTGYASISTAVEAIKLGATHYLPKPAHADEIISAFQQQAADDSIEPANDPMSVNRLEWEHINQVLNANDGNISATARALGMHRRTLQRKLAKHPVRK